MKRVWLLWLISLVALLQGLAQTPEVGPDSVAAKPRATPAPEWTLLTAELKGPIGPASVYYLEEAFAQLEKQNAKGLVIIIDTPGGLLQSTREIVKLINTSKKPVLTYVGPAGAQAASAGSFLLLAGHWAMMKEGTNTGAASPIDSSGADLDETLKKKVFQDTAALMRSVAESRKRNVEVAERFVADATSLTDKEALQSNVINQRVLADESLETALAQVAFEFSGQTIDFKQRTLKLVPVSKRPVDRFLSLIAEPQVAYLLTSLGSLGIYIEVMGGGLIFPGVLGVISLVLGLMALSTLPVNVGFLALLLFGVALLMAEVFVSGFGLLGLGGLLSFFLGSLYLYDEPLKGDYLAVVYTTTLCLGALFLALAFVVFRKPKSHSDLVDEVGVCVVSFLNGAGFVRYKEQNFKAINKINQDLQKGQKVKIVSLENDCVVVEAAEPEQISDN